MTNKNDPAFAHDGADVALQEKLLTEFPQLKGKILTIRKTYLGLTKREYFAAMAMQGALANEKMYGSKMDTITTDAIAIADMILDKLENKPTEKTQ